MADRRLRPLSLGDIFDEGFDLFKRNFTFLVLVTVVVTVPLDILAAVVRLTFFHDTFDLSTLGDNTDTAAVFAALGGLAVAFPVYALAYAVPITALAAATSARYLGTPITLRLAYRAPLRRLPSLLVTALLYGLALLIGALLCGFGLIIPAVLYLFTAHVFALEDKAFFGSLKRSGSLVSSDGGRVFSVLFLLSIIYSVIAAGIEVPLAYGFDKLLQIAPTTQGLFEGGSAVHAASLRHQIVDQISNGLADLLVTPFLMSVITVLYYDLRVRKEAFDIELLASDLGYAPLPAIPGVLPPAAPPLAAPVAAKGRSR